MNDTIDVNSPAKWEADYARGTDGWDLGGPTPAFLRLLSAQQQGRARFRPGRLLVPGAGRGHDAREFARHGFQVTAVDFSPYAVQEMRRLATPDAPLEILESDVFALPRALDGAFDYVLDYTCFCAIDPRRRGEYAGRVARWLKVGGVYIHLGFPLDAHAGGPPFAASAGEILNLFTQQGLRLLEREVPFDSVPQRRGLEELFVFARCVFVAA